MKDKLLLGQKLSPILEEIHDTLWEFEANRPGARMGWTDKDLRSAAKIFTCIMLDRAFKKGFSPQRAKMMGMELHELIKSYTDVDLKK